MPLPTVPSFSAHAPPAGAFPIGNSDSIEPPGTIRSSSFITSSTFDEDSQGRRTLVEIPKGLGFSSNPSSFQSLPHPAAGRFHERDQEREDEDDDDENAEEDEDEYLENDEDDDEEKSVNRIHHVINVASLNQSASNPNLYESASSSARASRAYSNDRLNPRIPLLHAYPSASASPTGPQRSLLSGSSSTSASPSHFQAFTPGSRRTYLQRKIDLVKFQNAAARKKTWWWGYFSKNPFSKKRLILIGLMLAIALSFSGELILRKVVTTNMYHYRWFLFQLISLLTFLGSAVLAYHQRPSIQYFIKHHGVPYRFLVQSSILDGIHGATILIAIGILPGLWGVVLAQLTIPMALLFRFFVTNGERCGLMGAVGSGLILIGVLGIIIPGLLSYQPCPPNKSSEDDTRNELILNMMILVIGLIPNAVSNIYKQSYLQHHTMNLYLMNLGISGMVMLWGILLSPMALQLQSAGSTGIETMTSGVRAPPIGSEGSSSDLSSLESPFNPVENDVIDYTQIVTHDVWTNWLGGWKCLLLGHNTMLGDQCAALYPALSFELLLFLLSMVGTQLGLYHLMQRLEREWMVAATLTAGVCLAACAFCLPIVQETLLPIFDLGRCFFVVASLTSATHTTSSSFNLTMVLLCIVVIVVGLQLGQYQPSQTPMDLDVWSRLEELELEEEYELHQRMRLKTHQAKQPQPNPNTKEKKKKQPTASSSNATAAASNTNSNALRSNCQRTSSRCSSISVLSMNDQ